jgi:hypothetical protein
MNSSFLADDKNAIRKPGQEYFTYAHPGFEGATRNTRGTPLPNETAEAFFSQLRMLDRDNPEPTNAAKAYAINVTDPEYNLGDGSSGFDRPQPRLYNVKAGADKRDVTGNPWASGLFTTDHIDPRPPESSAWLGNHRRPGWDPSGMDLIRKEFSDMDHMANGPYIMESVPEAPAEKTASFLYGRLTALRTFGLWP